MLERNCMAKLKINLQNPVKTAAEPGVGMNFRR